MHDQKQDNRLIPVAFPFLLFLFPHWLLAADKVGLLYAAASGINRYGESADSAHVFASPLHAGGLLGCLS